MDNARSDGNGINSLSIFFRREVEIVQLIL